MAEARRYAGGERVTIRDRGLRVDPEGAQIAEFEGATGTVFGHRSGFTVVSLDDGTLLDVREAELEDLFEEAPAPAAPTAPAPAAPSEPTAAEIEEQAARNQTKSK